MPGSEIFAGPWLVWAIAFAVGLPLVIVVLTEVIGALQRAGHPAQKPVRFLRNWVVPVAAVLALLAFAVGQPTDHVWVRIVATLLGFLVILLLLSSFNVALFSAAEPGTWRSRVPSIFVDMARLLLIVVGLAVLFWWVWGADVGGLFAALGVTSIVVGLALQNAVGGVVSGLLLLFEQPFTIGDWLDTGAVRGRVIEVNWRAVHIDTGAGIQIVPNAALAGSSFRNLSLAAGAYHVPVEFSFGSDDAPDAVIDTLARVAAGLEGLAEGVPAGAAYLGAGTFRADLPLGSPAREAELVGRYRLRVWYAARRAGLALDGDGSDPIARPEVLAAAAERLAPLLGLREDDAEALRDAGRLERFGIGELLQRPGVVPSELLVISEGAVRLWAPLGDGGIELERVDEGGVLGQTTLTREAAFVGATAIEVTTVLVIPLATIDALVRARPQLARRIGDAIEQSRARAASALAEGV